MIKKKCLVCGKEFEPCNSCDKDIDESLQWRRVVCCPEHFQYHLPIILYIRGKKSREEAEKELRRAIELYGEVNFTENIQKVVNEILGTNRTSEKAESTYETKSSRRSSRYRSRERHEGAEY